MKSFNTDYAKTQASFFQITSEPIFCNPYGNGHINETYLLLDKNARLYILQKVNKTIFKKPEELIDSIAAVTKHLSKNGASYRETLTLVPTNADKNYHIDDNGDYWRIYEFISDSFFLETVSVPEDFAQSGYAFGKFQEQLADFPASTLAETIPRFHDTPFRFEAFHKALSEDIKGRAKDVAPEIEFLLARESYAATLMNLLNSGKLPLRVTHNDTKLNNVLFDRITRKAMCVIDLDTVMPGLSVNDFGDSIRFGASTGLEDEQDLSKIEMSLELFEAYTRGYLSACKSSLTSSELDHLCDGAKMMTLECGMRFLTDYLAGDTYFSTKRENHNLDRARTQFKLVGDMETKWSQMQDIIKKHR